MPKLILMRHAKSSWSHAGPDHDRPLNDRGVRSAKALGKWLRSNGHMPDHVLCSSAKRTRLTLDYLDLDIPCEFSRDLYLADPDTLFHSLQGTTGNCILLIAHNPGIAEFADQIVAIPPDHPRFDDYPTGATLVAEFHRDNWSEIELHSADVLDFTVPRDLMQ